MADLDTRSKRASSVGILLGFALLNPPLPDATLDQGDRQHIAFSYSGILATSPVASPTVDLTYVALHKVTTVATGTQWATWDEGIHPAATGDVLVYTMPYTYIQVSLDVGITAYGRLTPGTDFVIAGTTFTLDATRWAGGVPGGELMTMFSGRRA